MGSACCCGKSKTTSYVVKPDANHKTEVINQLVVPTTKPPATKPLITKAPPSKEDDSAMGRCTKIGVSTTNPLPLINGYQSEPLVSLEEALQPFDGKINNLSHFIKEAKTKCHFPSEHGLTRDESAAIYIYTMKWGDGCLYDHLQAAWNSNDRNQLKPWFKYLKLFKSGLDKLPDAKGEVWQGVPFDEKLKQKLNSKTTTFYTTMGSSTQSANDIQDYLHKHRNDKIILAGYKSINGKTVTGYTAGSGGKEVLIWPGMKVGVSEFIVKNADGSVTVHLVGQPNVPQTITTPRTSSKTITPSTTPKNQTPRTARDEKHLKCPNISCKNRCRGNHDANHCYGFSFLTHECHHHCGPTFQCHECGKHIHHLRECNKCLGHFCDACCLK